jgi:hypothetical protein
MKPAHLLVVPLIAVIVSGSALAVAGVLAWGAATNPRYDDWIPTFEGLTLGGICVVGGALSLKRLWANLEVPNRLRPISLLLGFTACLLLTAACALTAPRLDERNHYGGTVFNLPFTEPEANPKASARGYVFSTLLVIFPGPLSWLLLGAHRLYARGVDPVSSVVPPVDAVGEILRSELGA